MKLTKLDSPHLIKPHTRVRLDKLPTQAPHPKNFERSAESSLPVITKYRAKLADLQNVFYASQQWALLIVLQGMDTAGKDGTIRHIFSGVNPQGCDVTAFKVPTPLEARHDFLWRAHAAMPARGMIGIFNRSHYEDVLSPVVHGTITRKLARERFEDINQFERALADSKVLILKFFLHISHEEQTRRLQARIDDPKKHWKLSPADFAERKFWPQYQEAYDDLLSATSHKHAPWFAIPADHKWQRDLAISQVLVDALEGLKLTYPKPAMDPTEMKL
jgi:PPK2 family polyphosphate:nucleotide phosphotransferase